MYLCILLLLLLALLRPSDAAYNKSVTVLVVDGARACQWAKARAFAALGCTVSVTVRNETQHRKEALHGVTLLQYEGHGRLDTQEFAQRYVALNRRTPRILCDVNRSCRAIRRAHVFTEAVRAVEAQMTREPACSTQRARKLEN